MVLIIINKSSLIVFFYKSFSFIPQIAANSFLISQKHSVNTGSSQPVGDWYTSNIKSYREYVDSLHRFTASAIMKTTETESWNLFEVTVQAIMLSDVAVQRVKENVLFLLRCL